MGNNNNKNFTQGRDGRASQQRDGGPQRQDGGPQRRDGGPPSKPQAAAVPIGSFYKDGKVDPDLFDGKAKLIAKSLDGVTGTQLRRLFDEVKRYDMILGNSDDQWVKQEPYIRMLNSKTSYTIARQQNTDACYKNLKKFINEGITLVHNKDEYHIFVSLFEAVYGFYYEIAPNKVKGKNS